MQLSIVIPALNEEQAIASIIERCLAAREVIVRDSPVDSVEIIVVSDGSTDRTVEIASGYSDVKLIVFEHNRGYGAAIKRGFAEAAGDVVGFLDADGTCDPLFFADLCRALVEESADVALGSRMSATSKMPRIRRLGNRIYAFILSALSNRNVTDTASGMRVIRRDALHQLYPLPDGLHFTPAMSARVLMDERLRIVEKPMSYEERVGESKLHVVRDGIRFLRTILEMTMMWRPARLFLAAAVMMLSVAGLLAIYPLEQWLRSGAFSEDMIYRLLFCSFLGTTGIMLLSAGVLADNLHRLLKGSPSPGTFLMTVTNALYRPTALLVFAALALPLIGWLIGPGIWSRITAGVVTLHWSRIVLAGVLAFTHATMLATGLLTHIMRFHVQRGTAQRRPLLTQKAAVREDAVRSRVPARPSADVLMPS